MLDVEIIECKLTLQAFPIKNETLLEKRNVFRFLYIFLGTFNRINCPDG